MTAELGELLGKIRVKIEAPTLTQGSAKVLR